MDCDNRNEFPKPTSAGSTDNMKNPGWERGNQKEFPETVMQAYREHIKDGYFEKGVIKEDFLRAFPQKITRQNIMRGLTSRQIRLYFSAVRIAQDAYLSALRMRENQENAEAQLLAQIRRLDGMVTNAAAPGKDSVPENFRTFLVLNIYTCRTAKDVLQGFIPHFEAVLGYFRYNNPDNNSRN